MLREYAVDPTELGRLGELWVLLEHGMGVSSGRVVAQFPKHWIRMVRDEIRKSDCPDVEKSSLIDRLNGLKKSVASLCVDREFSGQDWFSAAIEANEKVRFSAIVSNRTAPSADNLVSPLNLTRNNPLWMTGKPPIPRTSKEIANCAGPLGRISRHLLFVDPYLAPDPKRLSVVRAILEQCDLATRRNRRIELHVSLKAGNLTELSKAVRAKILRNLPNGTEVRILQWDQRCNGDRMHARYFLTEKGGIRFDYGLAEGDSSGETTDVQLLDESTYETRWANFQETTAAFELIGEPVFCSADC